MSPSGFGVSEAHTGSSGQRLRGSKPFTEDASDLTSRQVVLVGARWRLLMQLSQQLLSVAATLVLARLLMPADFGIVAIATSVLTFFQLGTSWGFNASVVRRNELDEPFLRGVFTVSLLIPVPLCVAGAALAPFVANVIGRPDSAGAIAALMPVMLLHSASTVPVALLQREMDFRRPAILAVLTTVLYVIVQLVLAWQGLGYWSVIIGQLVMATVQTLGLFWLAGWRPRWGHPANVIREEGRFSLGVLLSESSNYVHKNLDYWVVGAVFGAAALGAYYIAFVLPSVLRLRFSSVVQAVLFPVFSRLRSDRPKSQRVYAQVMDIQAALAIPAMTGLALCAPEVISVFFGGQWPDAVDPLRWIAAAAVFDLLANAHVAAAYAHGRLARINVVIASRIVTMAAAIGIALSLSESLAAIAAAVTASAAAGFVLGQVIVARPLGLHIGLIARSLAVTCLISSAMGLAVASARSQVIEAGASPLVTLMTAVAVGVVVYVSLGLLIAHSRYLGYGRTLRVVMAVSKATSDDLPSR